MFNNTEIGQVIIPGNTEPWPHEIRIAKILANAGFHVQFIAKANNIKTPDMIVDGIEYELKSPRSGKMVAIERNLKRATKQSVNIIFDSSRMRGLRDDRILRNVIFQAEKQKLIKRIIFIDKAGQIRKFAF